MIKKIFCFVAGVASGFAACLAVASLLPDEDECLHVDDPWR